MRGKTAFLSFASVRHLKTIFRRFSLRTQLLLIFLFVLIISISSLSIIYSQAEQAIMDKIGDSMDDMTKAIQISVLIEKFILRFGGVPSISCSLSFINTFFDTW